MPVGVGIEDNPQQTQKVVSRTNRNESVAVFREINMSPPQPAANDNNIVSNISTGIGICDVDSIGEDDNIPVSRCLNDIMRVLEKHSKSEAPPSLIKGVVTHRKITEFLNTILNCTTTTRDFILTTLSNYPYYLDLFLCNHLYMRKIFEVFKSNNEYHKTALHPVIIENVMCLLYRVQEHVLKEVDLPSEDGDDERWDSSEPAYDFLCNFTKGQGVNLCGSTVGTWFISNIGNTFAAEYFLHLIVTFHNQADFTVTITRWLLGEYIVVELVEALANINSSHDNIATVLLGLIDLARPSKSSRRKGHKVVAMLASHLCCSTTIDSLVSSTLSLLNHQPISADEVDLRTNGVKRCFEILSCILMFNSVDMKKCTDVSCSNGKNGKSNRGFKLQQNSIKQLVENTTFMTTLSSALKTGGPKTFIRTTGCGKAKAPFGVLRRSILGFIHDLVLHADEFVLVTLLKLETFEYLLKYAFWMHPLNSFVHLKVSSIAQILLKSGIEDAIEMIILRSNFIQASLEFLKNKKLSSMCQQKPFIMQMFQTLAECSCSVVSSSVKQALETWINTNEQYCADWETLMRSELPEYQKRRNTRLAGVPKPVKRVDNNNEEDAFQSPEETDDDDDDFLASDSD